MALPNHNGFIRLIYVVAILLMFSFVGWLIQSSFTSEKQHPGKAFNAAPDTSSQQPTKKRLTPNQII